jgi:hypothetical protein
MSVVKRPPKPDPSTTMTRLKALEEEWRERKAARLYKALSEASDELRSRFAGHTAIEVTTGERSVIVRLGENRELRLFLRLTFDEHGLLTRSFRVQDREIRRRPDFEELENQYAFDRLPDAIGYIVRACA